MWIEASSSQLTANVTAPPRRSGRSLPSSGGDVHARGAREAARVLRLLAGRGLPARSPRAGGLACPPRRRCRRARPALRPAPGWRRRQHDRRGRCVASVQHAAEGEREHQHAQQHEPAGEQPGAAFGGRCGRHCALRLVCGSDALTGAEGSATICPAHGLEPLMAKPTTAPGRVPRVVAGVRAAGRRRPAAARRRRRCAGSARRRT